MSNIHFYNVISENAVNGFRIIDESSIYKSGIYINDQMKTESGVDDPLLTGLPYNAYSLDGGIIWNYSIGLNEVITNHNQLSNLDFASSGHTGFAGLDVVNTFTQENIFEDKIKTSLINPLDTENIEIYGTNAVYIGVLGQDIGDATLYVNQTDVTIRATLDMNNHKITGVLNPSIDSDAMNLGYFNDAIASLYPDVYKVMLSGSDTAGFLNTKLLQGNGISFDTLTETLTVNSNIGNTSVGGIDLMKNGYTAKQMIAGDYIVIDNTADSLTFNFDYANFSVTTIWQDAVLDFADVDNIDTSSFVGGERYINNVSSTFTIDNIFEWKDGAWFEVTVESGFATWVTDEDISDDKGYWTYNGSSWVKFGNSISHNNLSGKDGGDGSVFYHLSDSERVSLVTGTNTTLHYHTLLRDELNNTVAYGNSNQFYVNNDLLVEGVETSITLKDTNTGDDLILKNANSVLDVDRQVKAEGFDFNSNKGVNVANPTIGTDVVNYQTLVGIIGTSIVKITDNLIATTSKTIESVGYTDGLSVKYMYNIVDSANNAKSGEINVIADSSTVDTTEYAVLRLGDDAELANYTLEVVNNTVDNEIDLIVSNASSTLDITVNVIRININIG